MAYGEFVHSCDASLMFHTPEYLAALTEILPESEQVIIAAYEDSQIIATLPTFIHNSEHGVVLNSLPYFGSHGDVLLANDVSSPQSVLSALANGLVEICREYSIGSINIVSHPLSPGIASLADQIGLKAWDSRIGQISRLPVAANQEEALEGVLATCRQKTRNLVRKGLRQGFVVEISTADEDWRQLILHHRLGMEKIGGNPKSEREFSAIRNNLEARGACRLYVARLEGEFAGALLNLYYRDWVEYFTPVIVDSFRSHQVLSALIATAMCDAVIEGRSHWNWGGTWSTQAGVHRFKQGWGAIDHIYEYFGAVWDSRLNKTQPRKLLEQFPFFYVRPFGN